MYRVVVLLYWGGRVVYRDTRDTRIRPVTKKCDHPPHKMFPPTQAQLRRATTAFDSAALRCVCMILFVRICCFAEYHLT